MEKRDNNDTEKETGIISLIKEFVRNIWIKLRKIKEKNKYEDDINVFGSPKNSYSLNFVNIVSLLILFFLFNNKYYHFFNLIK